MKISKKDRLILINQYRILAVLYPEDREHYDELAKILEDGYSIFYGQTTERLSTDLPEDEGKLVLNILDFYRMIEDFKRTNKNTIIGEHAYGSFPGFDGNNETSHLSFVRFLIDDQKKFSEQRNYFKHYDSFNSHMPMRQKYRRMIDKWQNHGNSKWRLSESEILEILDL